jgi:thiol:disulfide interchange protein/DsbC/DsbD-like thiol-disulfide interchange protein
MVTHLSLRSAHSLSAGLLALAIGLISGLPSSKAQSARDGAVAAELIAESTGIQPGKSFTVALRLAIDPGWHTYWINPGDAGLPTKVQWTLPPGFQAGPMQFPFPHKFVVDFGGFKQSGLGYEGEAVHLIEFQAPTDAALGSMATLTGKVDWLMCDDKQCVPGGVTVSLTLPVATTSPGAAPQSAEIFAKARQALPVEAKGWSLRVTPKGEKDLTLEISTPTGAALPDVGSLSVYPETANVIDLANPQRFRSEGGKLVLDIPKATYASKEIPSPIHALLTSDAGFGDFGGMKAIRIGDTSVAPPVPAAAAGPGQSPAISRSDIPALTAPAATAAVAPDADSEAVVPSELTGIAKWAGRLGDSLLGKLILGFLGGMILNVMPCVFPVISLKILSFVNHAQDERRKVLIHGALYSLGILLFFFSLAGITIALGAAWAEQFQSAYFNMIMAALMVIFAMSLFGVFELGASLTGVGGKLTQSSGYLGSFGSGALAVILATPCTGPFLGTSLAWALDQPPLIVISFFTMMAIGMAAPYVLLTLNPALTRRMPRPGAWMETFKQFMGFPMLGTAVWLLWVIEGQLGDKGQAFFMGALVLLALAVWAWAKFRHPAASSRSRATGLITAAAALAFATSLTIKATGQPDQTAVGKPQPSSQSIGEIIEAHRAAGKHVFVDFTARWCLICQTNKPAMHSEETKAAFAKYGVEFVTADWTNRNDDIFQYLKKHGRRAVPYYPLFPADQSKGPIDLPQNLTNGIILDHLQKLDNIAANFPEAKSTPAAATDKKGAE